jgi:hypothetical protein
MDRVVSPRGKVTWAYIERPDTKFSDEGEYRLAFTIPREDAKKFMAQIDEWMDLSLKESGAKKQAEPPYTEDGDDVLFKFKQKPFFKSKNGEKRKVTIRLIDSKLNPCSASVGRGSEVKVSFRPVTWMVQGGAGVTLYMDAVQIINLIPYNPVADMGFEEEEGFEDSSDSTSLEFKEEDEDF